MSNTDKTYSPCDYVNHARDNRPKPLTREYLNTLLDDMNVKMTCEIVREHSIRSERYKTCLPAICWQSRFGGDLRADLNAKPTGFFCLDVDIHHEQQFADILKNEGKEKAYAWAEAEARTRAAKWADMQKREDVYVKHYTKESLSIIAIHVSPSGTGVHVVACCNDVCKSIEENQKRLARLLDTSYDPVCKDWARIFFVTPREDWTYLDMNSLFA